MRKKAAVIDAIYLSDRTGQMEEPHRLLEQHGLTVEHCTALRPLEPEWDADTDDLDDMAL